MGKVTAFHGLVPFGSQGTVPVWLPTSARQIRHHPEGARDLVAWGSVRALPAGDADPSATKEPDEAWWNQFSPHGGKPRCTHRVVIGYDWADTGEPVPFWACAMCGRRFQPTHYGETRDGSERLGSGDGLEQEDG